MLGFHVTVYRQPDGRESPAKAGQPSASKLAVWQTGLDGLMWLRERAGGGEVVDLGGNGYPIEFSATGRLVLPEIESRMANSRDVWSLGEHDTVTSAWLGKDTFYRDEIALCNESEWLHIVAWDES